MTQPAAVNSVSSTENIAALRVRLNLFPLRAAPPGILSHQRLVAAARDGAPSAEGDDWVIYEEAAAYSLDALRRCGANGYGSLRSTSRPTIEFYGMRDVIDLLLPVS